jgi:hypothetical protein
MPVGTNTKVAMAVACWARGRLSAFYLLLSWAMHGESKVK